MRRLGSTVLIVASALMVVSCTGESPDKDLTAAELAERCPNQQVVLDEPAVTVNHPLPSLTVEADDRLYATVQTDDGPIFEGSGTSLGFVDVATKPQFDNPADPTEIRNPAATASVRNGRYRRLDLPPGRFVVSSTNAVRLRVVRC